MSDENDTPNISDVEGDEDEGQVSGLDLPEPPKRSQPLIPDLYSQFLEEQKKSESDPAETPYKSKYSARLLLRQLHGLLATELDLQYVAKEQRPVSSNAESTASELTSDERSDVSAADTTAAPDSAKPGEPSEALATSSDTSAVDSTKLEGTAEATPNEVTAAATTATADSMEAATEKETGEGEATPADAATVDSKEDGTEKSADETAASAPVVQAEVSGAGSSGADEAGTSPPAGDTSLSGFKIPRNILNMLLGHVHLQLGANYIDSEEAGEGHRNLKKAYDFLSPYRKTSECIMGFVSVCNQIGYFLSNRSQHKEALPYLQEAEHVYVHYTTVGEGLSRTPRGLHEMFVPSLRTNEGHLELHKSHTHTLYFLAQVFKELQQTELSAHYCMATLQRQLANGIDNPQDWALNCGTLSCYFLSQGRYADALHCLACATCMLTKAASGEDSPDEAAATSIEREEAQRKVASVSRLWVAYAMNLLDDSKKEADVVAAMCEAEASAYVAKRDELEQKQQEYSNATDDEDEAEPWNTRFPIEGTEAHAAGVPAKLVTGFDQARQLFLLGQKHIEQAKKFFTLDEHCTDNVELTQNHSQLYLSLASFEKEQDRICKMHRRRADMLLAAADALNPQYYLYIVRQLRFESAQAIIALLDTKYEVYEKALDDREKIDPKQIKKINMLIKQAKEQFDGFYASLRDRQGQMPETLSEDVARPAMLCKFHVARLYSKIITNDTAVLIENLKQSLNIHTEIVEQCKKQSSLAEAFRAELEVSQEMVVLLPKKMDKLSRT